MTKWNMPEITTQIHVINEALVQGLVTYNGRNFWYENDCGDLYLAELDGDPNEFIEISAACLCDAIGFTHVSFRADGELNACEGLWSEDLGQHQIIAGLCLGILLRGNNDQTV